MQLPEFFRIALRKGVYTLVNILVREVIKKNPANFNQTMGFAKSLLAITIL